MRPLRPADHAWLAGLHMDPDVMRFIAPVLSREAAALEAAARIEADRRDPRFGFWALQDIETRDTHGWVALRPLTGTGDIEVGFRLRRSSWGRGIATEAAQRLVEYGFLELGLERIVGVTMRGNIASERVLTKLGFRPQRAVVFDGAGWNHFALSRAEWPPIISGPSLRLS